MIKFFRHIRRSLINQNQMGKYFKYAIGEILLVVIGILLAIQINSYFNQRQARNDNKVFLGKMIEELKLNKNRMEYLLNFESKDKPFTNYRNAITNCDSLLKLTYRGLNAEDIPSLLTLKYTTGGASLSAYTTTYDELLNTGKLYTLGSDSLTNAVKNYYKKLAREEFYNESNNQEISKAVDLLDDNVGQIFRDYQYDKVSFSLDNYPWIFNKDSRKYKTFQLALSKILNGQTNNLIKIKQIISDSEDLIMIITKELNQEYD